VPQRPISVVDLDAAVRGETAKKDFTLAVSRHRRRSQARQPHDPAD
jgi:hypothetical protein